MKKTFIKIITSLIPIRSYRKAIRGILTIGIDKYKKIISKNNFKYPVSITAIMKNEGPYIKEWLDYHILVGIKKFYLYDNESTDNTTEILKPYIKKGIVDYIYWPGQQQQVLAYRDSIQKHATTSKWMAIIDLDEFIVPVHYDTIPEYLDTLPQNAAQLVIGWIQYGSSGHKHKQPGLLMENYKYHADKNWGVKSLVKPELVVRITNPHTHEVAGFTVDEDGHKINFLRQDENRNITTNKIRCNHYVTKSFDEYVARSKRGSAAQKQTPRPIERFAYYDHNEIYDDIMDKYIARLKKTSA